jgi:hypothetical protein
MSLRCVSYSSLSHLVKNRDGKCSMALRRGLAAAMTGFGSRPTFIFLNKGSTSDRPFGLLARRSAISRSSFGDSGMLAVAFAYRRLEYQSAPAETQLSVSLTGAKVQSRTILTPGLCKPPDAASSRIGLGAIRHQFACSGNSTRPLHFGINTGAVWRCVSSRKNCPTSSGIVPIAGHRLDSPSPALD